MNSNMLLVVTVLLLVSASAAHSNSFFDFNLRKLLKKKLYSQETVSRNSSLHTFTQTLDHFHPTNTQTWQQRYLASNGTTNVAFLMVGGEGAMDSEFFPGIWTDIADEIGAYTFELEHRFYGKSQPFENISLESLKYLSSDQALADTATFISSMNEQYQFDDNVIWIAFGGSYPGALAAWLRYKYPHLVHGVISSSAPLNATLNYPGYLEVVVSDINEYDPDCSVAISKAFSQIYNETQKNTTQLLINQLYLCDNFEPDDFLDEQFSATFFRNLWGFLAFVAQYGGTLSYNINDICYIMGSEELGNEMERFGYVVEAITSSLAPEAECMDARYSTMLEQLKDETLEGADGTLGYRQWIYQTCTEFGYYQTTDTTTDIFGNVSQLNYYIKICQDAFGEQFNETLVHRSVNNTNISKGGTNLEVTNIVFVQGSHDPWHKLGITESSNRSGVAIMIDGASHGNDMFRPNVVDSPALDAARAQIREYVLGWASASTNRN